MSPEQAAGDLDRLGLPSDVYSLGATLYCLLTGKPPFEDRDVDVVLGKVRRGEFPPPTAVNRAIDPALEAICLKAMALVPEGPLCVPHRPGRRHRALAGRRAGLGLPRESDRAADAVDGPASQRGPRGASDLADLDDRRDCHNCRRGWGPTQGAESPGPSPESSAPRRHSH